MAYINCHFYSKYLAHDTEISVVLPELWSGIPEGDYPVMYLLHGRGDDATSWVRRSSIEEYACEHRTAVVMPSAECSFYLDGVFGKRYFSYMTGELPDLIKAWFPVTDDPAKTYIAGLSMGGYGALKIGLSYPERFSLIGVFSAGIRPDLIPDYEETETGNEILHEDIRNAFGDSRFREEDNLTALVLRRQEEGRKLPRIIHYEGKQDMLYSMNHAFRSFAEEQKLDYRYEEWDGFHDWKFWNRAIEKLFQVIDGEAQDGKILQNLAVF